MSSQTVYFTNPSIISGLQTNDTVQIAQISQLQAQTNASGSNIVPCNTNALRQ